MSSVFVSYNRQSEQHARALAADLHALGHTPWLDQELSGGQAWWELILARIRDCDVFVFVLDPAALRSTACQREYGYAAALGKPVLPVLVTDGVSTSLLPPALSAIQFVDYRDQDRAAAFGLARAMGALAPAAPLPDPLPEPPALPISYLGSLTEKIAVAGSLSFEEQSALLHDLRRGLRTPALADDARGLLRELRARHDLLATIATFDHVVLGIGDVLWTLLFLLAPPLAVLVTGRLAPQHSVT